MEPRFDGAKVAPGIYEAMLGLSAYLRKSGLDENLVNLVCLRASQMNGCAYCIDMHWKDLVAAGEREQRLYGLDAWQESPYYSDRERAALAWAEAVTDVQKGHVPDEVYEGVRKVFTEKELADLTLAVVAINGWNRLNIAARTVPRHIPTCQNPRRNAEAIVKLSNRRRSIIPEQRKLLIARRCIQSGSTLD